jgi:hypothetical protein
LTRSRCAMQEQVFNSLLKTFTTHGWLGYDLLSVLHSSTLPHNPATSNGRFEGYK